MSLDHADVDALLLQAGTGSPEAPTELSAEMRTWPPAVRRRLPVSWPRVQLAGVTTDLFDTEDALDLITDHAASGTDPLAVVSVNLDHLHHFGSGRTSARLQRRQVIDLSIQGQVRWLTLLDGAPLVRRAGGLTGRPWPRLAGSDLIEPLLDRAQAQGLSIGFLGGSPQTHEELGPVLRRRWPWLDVAGFWSPTRAELADPVAQRALTQQIKEAGVDVLAVCLGKPRQERWIAEHAAEADVKVCLAFGAVVDFLAGRVGRAPHWVSERGLEWAWRLGNEPRRLARRYLVQGPPAYRALQRDSYVNLATTYFAEPATSVHPTLQVSPSRGRFASSQDSADIAVVVVTYNNGEDVDQLVASLRGQIDDLSLRVVVADNSSTDGTLDALRGHDDVVAVGTGGNLGYAGGINVAMRHVGETSAILVLNPDLELAPGALRSLWARLQHDGVGVVVPRLLDPAGEVYASLRREPSLTRALGDALFGERLSGRPGLLSEIELDRRQYRHAHQVDWATGASLLISVDVARAVGPWDEQFFLYSEEIDFLRRVRDLGWQVWFEPEATVQHRRGGSGTSDELEALMAVNRVRYAEKWHTSGTAALTRSAVVLGSLLRMRQSRHRAALRFLASRNRWSHLPAGTPAESTAGTEADDR